MITDEMVERACEVFSKADVIYPDGGERTQLTDWFKLDAQDALDFCVLKAAKWDSNSDIRAMQHEWYVAAVAKEPMRAALSAVMPAQVSVKPLEWKEIPNHGRTNFVADSVIGKWEFWEISNTGGVYICLAGEHQGTLFEGTTEEAKTYLERAYIKRMSPALATEGK